MPLQMIKNFSIKSGKSEAEVEKLWDKLKIEYKNDYPKIVGTLKKILNINEAEEGTYVARKVLNADSLYKHYKDQGVDVVPAEELHCTIAFSRKTFTPKLNDDVIEIKYDEEIYPYLEPLGDEGAVVMKFNNKQIIERWQDCIDRGATYDYPKYQPHITITFNGKDLDLKNIKRPDFYIELGDEYTEPLNLNWKEKINNLNDKKEKDMNILETLNSSKLMFIKSQMIKESIDDLTEDLVSKYLDLYEEHKISILESDKFLDLVENLEFDKLTEDEIDRLVEKCSEYSDEEDDDDDDEEEEEINESIKTSIMVLKEGKLGESISNLKETMYLMLGENQDFQKLTEKEFTYIGSTYETDGNNKFNTLKKNLDKSIQIYELVKKNPINALQDYGNYFKKFKPVDAKLLGIRVQLEDGFNNANIRFLIEFEHSEDRKKGEKEKIEIIYNLTKSKFGD